MKYITITLFLALSSSLLSQNSEKPETIVRNFFQAMYDVDTSYIASVLHEDASLVSTMFDAQSKGMLSLSKADRFNVVVAKSTIGDLDEQISNLRTLTDGTLAQVWMDYSFYYKGAFSHCGINNFLFALSGSEWKITSISDTRRYDNCKIDTEKTNINALLDDWHLAAAQADSTSYFDAMTPNAIFVGTDKSEVWSKSAFLDFAAPFFAKGKAWDFKMIERNIYSEDYTEMAWFDELLDTWMGPCRGSGVVVKKDGKWYIQHYVLSVTVPNDDIQSFLKIYEK